MGASRTARPAGVCVGVAVLAEIGAVGVGWGSTPGYQNILFALYDLTIVVIGGLIAVRHPGNAVGWILVGFGTFNAVFGDFIQAYGRRASAQGWPGGPLAQCMRRAWPTWSPSRNRALSCWTSGCRRRTPTRAPARAAEIKAAHPAVGVLLLSQHVETAHTVDLVARGGFGYLLKDRVLDVADFLAAVDRVARGGSALDPYVVGQLLHRTDGRQGLTDLTEREHEVLRMMAQGYTNAGVAKRLFLSERTVEAHVRRLLGKLDIADTEDAHRRILAVLTYLRAA